MDLYDVSHYSKAEVLRQLYSYGSKNNEVTAMYLAFIGEADARRIYAEEGCSSMHAFCVRRLHLSDSAAFKRIHAARAARRFPELFVAVADGRLHLSAVCMLAPRLTAENVGSLLAEATYRRKFEIEQVLARRFPAPDRLAVDLEIRRLPIEPGGLTFVPEAVISSKQNIPQDAQLPPGAAQAVGMSVDQATEMPAGASPLHLETVLSETSKRPLKIGAQRTVSTEPARSLSNPTPLSDDRYEIRFTVDAGMYERVRFAQNLLSHAVPSGSLPDLFFRGLGALVAETLKRRFAVGTRASGPKVNVARGRRARPSRPPVRNVPNRYVPSPVRRAVWERDGGRCTFVSGEGHRCEDERFLELDHVVPVARGGKPTVEGLRLRCRAHNQLEAERAFGATFMKAKRDAKRAVPRIPAAPVEPMEFRAPDEP